MHPESVYHERNVLIDFNYNDLPRSILRDYVTDIMPQVYRDMPQNEYNKRQYDIPLKTTIIFSKISRFYYYQKAGVNILCLA